jgi:hypothetical protein
MLKPVPWSWVFRKPIVPRVIRVVPFAETGNWLSHFFIPSYLNAIHIQTCVSSFVLMLLVFRFPLVCHVDSGLRDVKIKVCTYCSYPHACYVPCLPHLPGLYHPNDVFMLYVYLSGWQLKFWRWPQVLCADCIHGWVKSRSLQKRDKVTLACWTV